MDLISRTQAIDALAEDMPSTYTPDGSHPADEGIFMAQEIYADCIKTIEILPSAQPERKTGRWLIREGISDAQCSECKMYFRDVYDMDNSDAFCRQCGTKMEGLKVVEDE